MDINGKTIITQIYIVIFGVAFLIHFQVIILLDFGCFTKLHCRSCSNSNLLHRRTGFTSV
jgi:hypothetical protein